MVSRIENVRLLPGGVALARATDGRPFIMAESFNSYWERSVHHAIVREAPDAFRLKETVRELAPLAGRYLYLDTQHTGHFGHFFVDVLTRAWGYRAAVNAGVSELKVLVPRLGSNFMTPFLCAAGIPEDAIVPLDRPVACQELFVATKCFQTHGYTTRTAVAFWQKLRDALDQGDGPERVYVSRSKTGNRKLTNEAEVEDLFASLGFAIVHPQEMSVADQVTCFANARFLAGPNGSNLFQLAFQRKLERALVINSPSMLRFSELMLQASYSSATTIHVGRTDNTDPHGAWYVPMDDLRRTVEEWMNGA
jgi:capsular polysaccharide biosynthesis protein